jgi:prepilin-type processing-associated H-X9-DG protein
MFIVPPIVRPRVQPARRPALTLIELLALTAVLAIIVAFLFFLPVRPRRGSSGGLVCGSNLKALGTSMKIYANDFDDDWAVAPFDETMVGHIDYTVAAGSGAGSVRSPSRTQVSVNGDGGTRQLSVTRTLWMLVRSGDNVPKSFICPTSGDSVFNEQRLDNYYDFAGPQQVSYGFQVPYGPKHTRAAEAFDPRVPLAADRGPYADPTIAVPDEPAMEVPVDRQKWRPYNSRNHGGQGQNVLYADGHAAFERHPFVGVDRDNIYTVAAGRTMPTEFMVGESPWARSAHPFAPLDSLGNEQYTTDSLIFP